MKYAFPSFVLEAFAAYQDQVILIFKQTGLSEAQATLLADNGLPISDNCFWQSLSPSTACIQMMRDLPSECFNMDGSINFIIFNQ
jgi:hypothetical protein